MSNLITQAEYSRHRGCSREAVRQAIEAGRISTLPGPNGRKLIDPDVADIEWKRNTDQKQSERANASKRATEPAGASLRCSGCAVGFALGAWQLAGATVIVATDATRGINETEGVAGAGRGETFNAPDFARRAAQGDFSPVVLAWLRDGFGRHLADGTPVEAALRLDRASRLRVRNEALRRAAMLLKIGDAGAWTVAGLLLRAVERHSRLRATPSTPLEIAVEAACTAGAGMPASQQGIFDIIVG